MIRLRGMHKSYRTGKVATEVLRGIDLDIDEGELVAIIGPSGSGKTTLLHAIGGLDSDYTGTVEVDGKDLHALSDAELSDYRNRTVGFVFQHFYLLPHLTCLENVTLPHVFSRAEQMQDGELRKRGMEVLEQVDLTEKAEDPPTTLSGGQRQRIAIARALFNRPRLLLCDEPTGNLDSKLGASILALFRDLNEQQGITVLIVTHDPNIAAATRRQILVADGRLANEGVDDEHDEQPAQEVGQ
jgi:ABC-type lipoprotein export system ATPase subunit